MKTPVKVTISKTDHGNRESTMCIEIHSETSQTKFRIEMSLVDFAQTLTGLARQAGELESGSPWEHFGMQRETKRFGIPKVEYGDNFDLESWVLGDFQTRQLGPEGWELVSPGRMWKSGGTYSVQRWVPALQQADLGL